MKKLHRPAPRLMVLGALLLWLPAAHAGSTFSGSAALTYTLTGIANLDHPGDLSGLTVIGSFHLAPPPDYALSLSGDGTVLDENSGTDPVALTPVAVGATSSHRYSVKGDARNGSVEYSGLGLFGLSFENTGADRYALSLALNYRLEAAAHGQYADSSLALDFYNEAYTFLGSDRVMASVFTSSSAELTGTTGIFSFTLAPGESEALYADVRIAGNLEASPVPLPAAAWLMITGLSFIAAYPKRRGA